MMVEIRVRILLLAGLVFAGGGVKHTFAQDEVGSKGIKAEEFIANRPAKLVSRRATPGKKPTYNLPRSDQQSLRHQVRSSLR